MISLLPDKILGIIIAGLIVITFIILLIIIIVKLTPTKKDDEWLIKFITSLPVEQLYKLYEYMRTQIIFINKQELNTKEPRQINKEKKTDS